MLLIVWLIYEEGRCKLVRFLIGLWNKKMYINGNGFLSIFGKYLNKVFNGWDLVWGEGW